MHTGAGGGGPGGGKWVKLRDQMKIFKKLVNKNAIKPKIGDLPGNFVLKALTPMQKSELSPPMDF
jgi:hypothetical protein